MSAPHERNVGQAQPVEGWLPAPCFPSLSAIPTPWVSKLWLPRLLSYGNYPHKAVNSLEARASLEDFFLGTIHPAGIRELPETDS